MITIIHPLDVSATTAVGGIETWNYDFLKYSTSNYLVLGCSRTKTAGEVTFRAGIESLAISSLPVRRIFLPDIVRYAFGLIRNRGKISSLVLIHRIDLVPIIRFLSPKTRIVLFIHTNLMEQAAKNSDSFWRFFPKTYFRLESYALSRVHRLGLYSIKELDRISRINPKTELVQSWYNDEIFTFKKGVRNVDILWAGRFERVKDPILAVETIAELLKNDPSLTVSFAGSGSLLSSARRAAQELGLQDKIYFMGPLTQPELARTMRESKVFLQTSHFEGSPRILLEALGSGCKIVTTVEGDPEHLSRQIPGCAEITVRDPKRLADALRSSLNSPAMTGVPRNVAARRAPSVVKELEALFLIEN